MTASVVALALEGPAAPPRSNGELVFSEPWESRIFGMAVSMHQAGCFEWAAFQGELIAAIGRWEAAHDALDNDNPPRRPRRTWGGNVLLVLHVLA